MLVLVWLLEQGVVVAPAVGVVLYLRWPKRRRDPWLKAVTVALVALFAMNFFGIFPRPATVSCGFERGVPVCVEKTSARGVAETLRADTRTVTQRGSAEVETPCASGGGSLVVSAGAVDPQRPAPAETRTGLRAPVGAERPGPVRAPAAELALTPSADATGGLFLVASAEVHSSEPA